MSGDSIDYGLKPLWDAIIPIYREFRRICKRHSLRHWAAYGTALGAARHNGFIPWDDDFDVMMPRRDYEEFIRVAPRELPDYLRVVNWRNTEGYQWLFGKVQDVRQDRLNGLEAKMGRPLPQGVYIDIFPCDGWPTSLVDRFKKTIWGFMICARREYCTCPSHKRRRLRRMVMIAIGSVLAPWFRGKITLRDFVEENEARMKNELFNEAQSVVACQTTVSLGLGGTVYPSDVFASGDNSMPFENVEVEMMSGWEKYLQLAFGDWRKLPPVEKRGVTHRDEEIAPWRH